MDRGRGLLGEPAPAEKLGVDLHALAASLFPICRSITGNGVRETLGLLQGHLGSNAGLVIH